MANSTPDGSNFGGEATAIVRTLKDYQSVRKSLPIDFVARMVGRQPKELDDSLRTLKQKGVIQIDDARREVTLAPEKKQ